VLPFLQLMKFPLRAAKLPHLFVLLISQHLFQCYLLLVLFLVGVTHNCL